MNVNIIAVPLIIHGNYSIWYGILDVLNLTFCLFSIKVSWGNHFSARDVYLPYMKFNLKLFFFLLALPPMAKPTFPLKQ